MAMDLSSGRFGPFSSLAAKSGRFWRKNFKFHFSSWMSGGDDVTLQKSVIFPRLRLFFLPFANTMLLCCYVVVSILLLHLVHSFNYAVHSCLWHDGPKLAKWTEHNQFLAASCV